jgi:hypothetical protein
MAKKKGKRPRRPRKSAPSRRPLRRPRLVTPEGDSLVFAGALYNHNALDEIRLRLREADDFDWEESLEPGPGGRFQVTWLETEPDKPSLPDPLSRRILATLTLTPATLEVETISRRRRRACQRRLEALLGDHIQLVGMETKAVDQALREPAPQSEPEPLDLPPEFIAEMEERMIRQWLEESIPALGGLTPREAVKTPEGRQRLLDLFDYISRDQERREMPPGMFSPDYRKAKEMLGLE